MQPINLRHNVRSQGGRGRFTVTRSQGTAFREGTASGRPLWQLGDGIHLDWPKLPDARRRGNLGRLLLGLVQVVELHRYALEYLVVEVHSHPARRADVGNRGRRILNGKPHHSQSVGWGPLHDRPRTQRCRLRG